MLCRCKHLVATLCCLLSAVLVARPAAAHVARPLTLTELVSRSDATLLGHTLKTRSFWQGTRILTTTTVAVDEIWLGTLAGANTIDVVTLGGVVGELGQRVDGAAELSPYGRMVLHVQRTEGEYTPTAMAEGVWYVDGLWGDASAVYRAGTLPSWPFGSRPAAHQFAKMGPPTLRTLREWVVRGRTPQTEPSR